MEINTVGYGWKKNPDGTFDSGWTTDFLLKDKEGNIKVGKEDFANLHDHSYYKNKETMLTLTVNVHGFAPGDYIAEFRIHDIVTTQSATFDLPFKVASP